MLVANYFNTELCCDSLSARLILFILSFLVSVTIYIAKYNVNKNCRTIL